MDVMKEKDNNTRRDENESTGMAAEPVAAVRSDLSALGYDIDNWPGMPLVGPDNITEMNARIDQAERDMDDDKGFAWEQVMMDAQSIVNLN